MEIHDILVRIRVWIRIRIPGSVPLDPDPAPDPTPFFTDFKDARKYCFSYFFLITCPQAHHLLSKMLNFLLNLLFCRHYFRPLITFLRKGKDPDPHLRLMDPDGPKTWGSCGSGSGSPTLVTPAQDLTRQDKKLVSRSACLLPEQAYLIYAW